MFLVRFGLMAANICNSSEYSYFLCFMLYALYYVVVTITLWLLLHITSWLLLHCSHYSCGYYYRGHYSCGYYYRSFYAVAIITVAIIHRATITVAIIHVAILLWPFLLWLLWHGYVN